MAKKETWKPVTISGLTGILMGAGVVYGVQTWALGNNEVAEGAGDSDGIKGVVANDDLSFADAFNAARAKLGPGGVFTWRGNAYNTYTEEEWRAMTEDQQDEFAEEVNPEIGAADVDVAEIVDTASDDEGDVQIAENVQPDQPTDSFTQAATWNDIVPEENDVRVIGYGDVETAEGRSVTMQELDVNGQRVAIIDVDKDGDPDLAMTDLNQNQQMDDGEVIDLHTGEAVSFTNDDIADTDYTADVDFPNM